MGWLRGASCCNCLALVLVGAGLPPPPLPRQTKAQAQVSSGAKAVGRSAESAGKAVLLQALRSPSHQHYLKQFDPDLGDMPAEELLGRFLQELEVAELVDNFGRPDEPEWNCGKSVTLDPERGPHAPYFYNQWMLQALDILPLDPDNNVYEDAVETSVFGFQPFANASRPDIHTAASRPVYAGLNMFRASAGNPQCGPISADYFGNGRFFRCEAWPPEQEELGAPGFLSHLILPYATFFNATQEIAGEDYPLYNLARLVTRLLSRNTYGRRGEPAAPVHLNWLENAYGYMEMNALVTVQYPQGISMLLGVFEVLFGTPDGDRLRSWCLAQGWPLAWATNPIIANWNCGPYSAHCILPVQQLHSDVDAANERLLDPVVLRGVPAGHNLTGEASFPELEADFARLWREPRGLDAEERLAWSRGAWKHLSGAPALAVEPLYHGACASDRCVAVRLDGACVCPPEATPVKPLILHFV